MWAHDNACGTALDSCAYTCFQSKVCLFMHIAVCCRGETARPRREPCKRTSCRGPSRTCKASRPPPLLPLRLASVAAADPLWMILVLAILSMLSRVGLQGQQSPLMVPHSGNRVFFHVSTACSCCDHCKWLEFAGVAVVLADE